MKKLLILGLSIPAFLLTGCTRNLETKTIKEVTLNIDEVHHTSARSQPVVIGKIVSSVYYPAEYEVEFEYNGYEFEIDDKEIYEYCKDKKSIKANIYISTYDNGDIEYSLRNIIK